MKIKDRAKPKLPPVEPGVYIATCVGVVDLGEQYSEKFKNYRNEVQFIWELSGETVEVDGEVKPRQLSRTFSFAVGKKSSLRGFLSSWNGVQYSDEQFGELEVFDQVGRACQLNVVLNDTGEYANVDSVIPLPKGMWDTASRTAAGCSTAPDDAPSSNPSASCRTCPAGLAAALSGSGRESDNPRCGCRSVRSWLSLLSAIFSRS